MAVYVEDGLAGVIRCAAEFGKIPGVDASRVYTDENAVNEWGGEDKVYVARGGQTPVYDVTSVMGNAGCTIGEFALAALSGTRAAAQNLAASVWDAVLYKFEDESWAEEYIGSDEVDFLGEVKDYASLFHVEADDEFYISTEDRMKASAFDFDGAASGTGILVGGALWSARTLTVQFRTSRLGVLSWIYDKYNTVPRTGGGSYQDEWFSTHTIRTVSMN